MDVNMHDEQHDEQHGEHHDELVVTTRRRSNPGTSRLVAMVMSGLVVCFAVGLVTAAPDDAARPATKACSNPYKVVKGDGWIVIAAPRHVPDAVADLPQHIRLDDHVALAVDELLVRMASDAQLPVDRDQLDGLLALQTRVLASRLAFGDAHLEHTRLIDPVVLERYREFRAAVEREFRRWHLIAPYARHLGYSAKSLDRSCRAAAAMSAKRVIVERIVLEAKRLIAHTELPVASISAELGFDEPTNFVKYIKRETGSTPNQLRVRFSSDPPT
jgi:AraC-like DNA-binding protein